MKKTTRIGFASAFCAGMLALTACSQPQTSYGAPQDPCSEPPSVDVTSDTPEDVYGPPVVEESAEDSALSSAEN